MPDNSELVFSPFPVIQRSWQRCREHGLSPHLPARHDPLAAAELKRRREQHRMLMHLAAGELQILRRAIAGTNGMVLLSGHDGTILDACGDTEFVSRARRVSLQPGADWNESREGTNAVGTALIERQLVEVYGDQHFLEDNHFLVCTAMPIMDPGGELAGVIDISGDVRQAPAHSSMLVQSAAARIEHAWVSRKCVHDLLVGFHPHPAFLGSPHEGLMAFRDQLLVAANPIALHLLGLAAESIHHLYWSDIFRELPSYGQKELRIKAHGGLFYANLQKPQVVHSPVPGLQQSASAEVIQRDGAVWDSETIVQLAKATRALDAGIPILLQGETGTGKEIFVRALHRHSSRASGPFVPVNCAAIPDGLLEAELFGYEEGAFTGARRRGSVGHIRRAQGGSLFLDEIGDMPLALQAQLLRVLQDGEVIPLGSGQPVRVDFRLVAATHHDLQAAVQAKTFRADLYYRLRHMVLTLPPLRERHNVQGILDAMLVGFGADARGIRFTAAARQRMLRHSWPGNLREMANLLRTLISLAEDDSVIDVDSLPPDIAASTSVADGQELTLSGVTDATVRRALEQHRGNMSAAARQLGLHRSTLYRRLHNHEKPH